MSGVSRRRFLSGAGLAGVGFAGAGLIVPGAVPNAGATQRRTTTAAPAEPAACAAPEKFGTAVETAAIVGATLLDKHAYVVTRGQRPPVLAEVDLTARKVTQTVDLERGDGGWGAVAAGGQVYAGTYPYPDLWRFDPASGTVSKLGTIGAHGDLVMCMTKTPNDKVYAGTFDRAEVWGYDPGNGKLWKLAKLSGEKYVRAIAADDKYVYAGTLPSNKIVAIDRGDAKITDITPGDFGGPAALMVHDGRIYGVIGNHLVDFKPDGSDVKQVEAPKEDRLLDALTAAPDGTVYCVGRPTGTVYRRTSSGLEKVASAVDGDECRGVFPLDDQTLLGAAGSGLLWTLNTKTKETKPLDLIEAGLSGPDLLQSIAYGPGTDVQVGGHFSLVTHQPGGGGEPKRIHLAGEPKQLRVVGSVVYAALYPSSELVSIDPADGKVTSLGQIDHGQSRPTDMKHLVDDDLLLITSGPPASNLSGALTVVDRADGHKLTVYADVITDQAVTSVSVENGVAYLSGDTWGGGSGTPTKSSASVVAFDLASRKVVWEAAPLADHESIEHLAVHDGVIYGVYKRPAGAWFAMDAKSQKVLRQGKLSHYGEVTVHRGHVFASVHDGTVYRLGPDLDEPVVAASDLGKGWYNKPQLAFVPDSWQAWTSVGSELARITLDPSCA